MKLVVFNIEKKSNCSIDTLDNIDLFIPKGTTNAYENAGWIGFKTITEDAILSNTEFAVDTNAVNLSQSNGQLTITNEWVYFTKLPCLQPYRQASTYLMVSVVR